MLLTLFPFFFLSSFTWLDHLLYNMNYHHSQFMNYQLQGHYYPPPPPIPPHVVAAFNEYYYNNYNDYHRDYHSLGYRKQGHRKQRKPRKLMRSLSTGSISPKVYHYYTLVHVYNNNFIYIYIYI
jgi:hypothetical protein